jgi:uncharacterized protein YegJ (DUF2314 family)
MTTLDQDTAPPWRLDIPEPTDLHALLAIEDVPEMEQIGQAVATFAGETIDAVPMDAPQEFMVWFMRMSVRGLPSDLAVWIEHPSDDLLGVAEVEGGIVLGVQTMLSADDPLTHFVNLFRLIAGSLPEVCGIGDLVTGRWHPREVIDNYYLSDETEPAESVLWVTHHLHDRDVVCTNGLARCGRAELAMIDVPDEDAAAAVDLIDGVAALSLESALPEVGVAMELGHELTVSLRDWEQLPTSDIPMPGPCGVIAAVDGGFPTDVLQRMRQGDASIARTMRSTRRRAVSARDTWDLVLTVARLIGQRDDAACLVQVPYAAEDDANGRREHLWFRIVDQDGQSVIAELAHAPRVAQGLTPGHRETIARDDITDWLVMTPIGPLGTDDIDAIHDFVDQLGG